VDLGGIANGFRAAFIGRLGLKLCCRPCKSVVENDCLNIFGFVEEDEGGSLPRVEKTPAPGTWGADGRGTGTCWTVFGALWVL
jgi:hypothetical protein